MPYTIAVVSSVVVYVWFLERVLPREFVLRAGDHDRGADHSLTTSVITSGDCRGPRLHPACGGLFVATSIMAAIVLGAGAALGTLHDRRDFLGSLAPLVVWGAAQHWVLQTVVLREAQRATSRQRGIVLAAVLFGAIHLPNPFLAPVTAVAALVWCRIYDRYPNIIPLALSHGLGTLAVRYAFDDAITGRLRIGASYLRLDL